MTESASIAVWHFLASVRLSSCTLLLMGQVLVQPWCNLLAVLYASSRLRATNSHVLMHVEALQNKNSCPYCGQSITSDRILLGERLGSSLTVLL